MPNLYFYIITISTLTGIIYFKKWLNTKNQYFVYFLIFTFIIDKLGYFNRLFGIITIDNIYNNHPIFNLYSVVTFVFFFLFYKYQFKKKHFKNTMNWFLAIYLIAVICDIFYIKSNVIKDFLMLSTTVGSVLLILSLILFLLEITLNKNIIFNVEKSLIFWISLGCLLFYVGVIPIIISYKELNFEDLFSVIHNSLNAIAHLCFVIGFMYSNKKYDY